MATTNIGDQVYPFSTEDSKSIPLDIIRPLALSKLAISPATIATLVIPGTWKIASFYCPSGCYIEFFNGLLPSTLVDGTLYADTLFVPPNCVVTSTVIPGTARVLVLGANASYLIAQNIQKWAGLTLSRKLTTM